ncbi:polysaccharide deacetylase family protein [Oceanicella actignis]|uniref:polysaccharide deacetylase family protein n=1 Tax=Oceanicella actignis TaxID=1189325 RepID=UPI0011E85A7D|nr:polysaccharide deacetylase family protein [Oceanicella actignis]TYO88755.1 polysaccharide deacetylase [Oceanicella actignis]
MSDGLGPRRGGAARALVRRAGIAALARGPLPALARRRAARRGAAAVLCWHAIGPDGAGPEAWTVSRLGDLRAQFAELARRWQVVPLDEALALLDAPPRRRPGPPPRPLAALTFDDGDASLHAFLPALLDDLGLCATIFVATAQIETGRPFWFDRVMNALLAPAPFTLDLRAQGLGLRRFDAPPGAGRWPAISALLEALKALPPDRREEAAASVVALAPPAPPGPRLGPMSLAQLRELAAHPRIAIGAHSHGHELMDRIAPEAARASIARSRALLAQWTGRAPAHFAWPNGNWSDEVARIAAQEGFASAAALGPAEGRFLLERGARRHAYPRIAVGRYDSLDRFRLRLAGL